MKTTLAKLMLQNGCAPPVTNGGAQFFSTTDFSPCMRRVA